MSHTLSVLSVTFSRSVSPGLSRPPVLTGALRLLTLIKPDHSSLVFVARSGVKTTGNLPAIRIACVLRPTAVGVVSAVSSELADSRETL
jgi:hypothetical protein